MSVKVITVFCGSHLGNKPEFVAAVHRLGKGLAVNKVAVKFGGGRFGMMGELARAVVENGGDIIPIPTEKSWKIEAVYNAKINNTNKMFDYTARFKPVFAPNFMERKKLLRSDTDGFCVFPGSTGTFDELFEIMVLKKVGEITMPIVLLDVAGYWAKFRELLDNVIANGFGDESIFDTVTIVNEPEDVLPMIQKLRLAA